MRSVARGLVRALLWANAAVLVVQEPVWETVARADEFSRPAYVDTTYGRVNGDLGVSVGVGATFSPSAPRGTLDLRLRYLDTVGIFGGYEDGLSATSSDPRRVLAMGFEIRPLFLARWL